MPPAQCSTVVTPPAVTVVVTVVVAGTVLIPPAVTVVVTGCGGHRAAITYHGQCCDCFLYRVLQNLWDQVLICYFLKLLYKKEFPYYGIY